MPLTITNAIVTAYCHGVLCASGVKPTERITIAGPRSIPFGTIVIVEGQRYIVQDRTAKRFDGRWDIYMKSRKSCIEWGKKITSVEIKDPAQTNMCRVPTH